MPLSDASLAVTLEAAREPQHTNVSHVVRQAIRDAGMTQTQVAKALGVTRPAVSRLCDPKYSGHSVRVLREVARVTGFQLTVEFGCVD